MMQAPDQSFVYGVLSRATVATMTGREVLEAIVDRRLPQAPISGALQFWLTEVGEGFAAFQGETASRLLNPMGSVHGGWALTLIDSVGGCAAYSLLPAGAGYTTIETKGNLCRPISVETGRVRAEARVLSQGRQIISAEARVLGPDGKVLAHGSTTVLVMGGAK
jgi:uncharacterized protein (TIGR00369 family)